jgi:hypothetical protein
MDKAMIDDSFMKTDTKQTLVELASRREFPSDL